MKISIRNAFETAVSGADITVFIDVFRASTTLAYMLGRGAEVVCAHNTGIVDEYMKKGYTLVSEVLS